MKSINKEVIKIIEEIKLTEILQNRKINLWPVIQIYQNVPKEMFDSYLKDYLWGFNYEIKL